jgi:hypothetical protein
VKDRFAEPRSQRCEQKLARTRAASDLR